jgi:hypothetical protein
MRFLRRQTFNRRAVYDNTLYVDTNNAIVMGSQNNLTLPTGPDSTRPAVPVNGMIRYNTTSLDIEVYQGSTWRALRYRESGSITQQTLGIGDGDTLYYGPLSPAPTGNAQRGYTWTGANLLVLVENVLQLHTTNYTVVQNPTFPSEVYIGKTSVSTAIGVSTLYFNTTVTTTAASGTGTTVTLTFSTKPVAPFAIGETIIVAGVIPYEYNGEFTVTGSTASTVSYAHTATGAQTTSGTIESASTVYPAVNILGATLSGNSSIAGRTVTSYVTDPDTGALSSMVLSAAVSGSVIAANTAITITKASQAGTGYYLYFSSPIPPGKAVTALIGFDQ